MKLQKLTNICILINFIDLINNIYLNINVKFIIIQKIITVITFFHQKINKIFNVIF
jgi:hypothetical protein